MLIMVAGMAILIGAHLIPAAPELRGGLAARYGEGGYKIAFSVISIIGLALIVFGWHKLQGHPEKAGPLWDPPLWTRHIAHMLMLPVFILLVAAYVPSRIRTAVKHPMLLAVKLWALAHLIAAGGSLAALILFGGFLGFAVYDRISVKRRGIPVATAPDGWLGDITAVVVGLGLYWFMMAHGHAWLIGVPVTNIAS